MRLRIHVLVSLALGLLPASVIAADQCSADCTHATRACVCALETSGISFTPIGGVDRQPVQLRQALEPGDEIISANENAVVGLTCPGSSDVKLHGRFRAVIMPPAPGQDCAFNLLAGNADVLTNNPTQVSSGETLMGSRRTMYSMRVSRDATVECVVFEGQVGVQNLKTGVTRPLEGNTKASWRSGQLVQFGARVLPADITNTTLVYARADVARAQAKGVSFEDPASFQRMLQATYAEVLTKLNEPTPRIELAALQTLAGISTQALYHIERAERLNPARTDQRAAIAATKWAVYKQIGREQDAAVESEKLRRLDPERFKVIQRIDPKVSRVERSAYDLAALRAGTARSAASAQPVITVTASPPVVRIGETTTIAVSATTRDGKPIGGAKVVLSVGGGTFTRTGQTRLEGLTDANGGFRTEWLCKPCAAAYRIDVEVAAAQFLPAKATVDVKTR